MTEPRPIVVGVDGSAASRAALRWATVEAAQRDLPVLAVMVHLPVGQIMIGAVPYDALPPSGVAAEHADRERQLHEIIAETETHGVPVEQIVVAGKPWEELVRLSTTAELLVVGGHSNVLLGTTGSHCARRAQCPVVVLPKPVWMSDKEEVGHDHPRD